MSELEKITKEVRPTSLEPEIKPLEASLEELNTLILQNLSIDQAELFKIGQAKQGNKISNTVNILRDSLYNEVENLKLTKEIDGVDRSTNSITKKSITFQIDSILRILEMSLEKSENKYFILGLIVKSMFNK